MYEKKGDFRILGVFVLYKLYLAFHYTMVFSLAWLALSPLHYLRAGKLELYVSYNGKFFIYSITFKTENIAHIGDVETGT